MRINYQYLRAARLVVSLSIVHKSTFEAKFLYASPQLVGCNFRVVHGKCAIRSQNIQNDWYSISLRKSSKSVFVTLDLTSNVIVDFTSESVGFFLLPDILHTRSSI